MPAQGKEKKQEQENKTADGRCERERQTCEAIAQSTECLGIGGSRDFIAGVRQSGAEPDRADCPLSVEIADLCDGILGCVRREFIAQRAGRIRELRGLRECYGLAARQGEQGLVAADKIEIGLRFFIVIIGALRIDGFEIGKAEVQEFFCVTVMCEMTVQNYGNQL